MSEKEITTRKILIIDDYPNVAWKHIEKSISRRLNKTHQNIELLFTFAGVDNNPAQTIKHAEAILKEKEKGHFDTAIIDGLYGLWHLGVNLALEYGVSVISVLTMNDEYISQAIQDGVAAYHKDILNEQRNDKGRFPQVEQLVFGDNVPSPSNE